MYTVQFRISQMKIYFNLAIGCQHTWLWPHLLRNIAFFQIISAHAYCRLLRCNFFLCLTFFLYLTLARSSPFGKKKRSDEMSNILFPIECSTHTLRHVACHNFQKRKCEHAPIKIHVYTMCVRVFGAYFSSQHLHN